MTEVVFITYLGLPLFGHHIILRSCVHLERNVLIIYKRHISQSDRFRIACVDHTNKHVIRSTWILVFNIVDLRALLLWRSSANSCKMIPSTTAVAFSALCCTYLVSDMRCVTLIASWTTWFTRLSFFKLMNIVHSCGAAHSKTLQLGCCGFVGSTYV